jgi:hypothetical protein
VKNRCVPFVFVCFPFVFPCSRRPGAQNVHHFQRFSEYRYPEHGRSRLATTSKLWGTVVDHWLLGHIPALLFWWAAAAGLVNSLTGEELIWSSTLLFFSPIIALVTMLILYARHPPGIKGIQRIVIRLGVTSLLALYYLAFPIYAPARIIMWLPTGLQPLKQVWRYTMWSLHIVYSLVYVPLLLLSWYVLWASQRPNVITGAVVSEVALNTLILFVALRWASNPRASARRMLKWAIWHRAPTSPSIEKRRVFRIFISHIEINLGI